MPGVSFLAVSQSGQIVNAAGSSGRVYRRDLSTSIEPLNNGQLPGKFSLSQNYPNPFNPSTNVEFALSEPGYTKLSVYNVTGNKVAVLVNENLKAGTYTIKFNGSNLTSGIYYLKLEAGSFSKTRKMVLLK